jgi:hypothetical protein
MKRSAIVLLPVLLSGLVKDLENSHHPVTPGIMNQVDGPYVFYKKNSVFVNYILDSNDNKWIQTDTASLETKRDLVLNINTGILNQSFSVRLKDQLKDEKDEFDAVSKLFAVSDIEGDFNSFRQLLQANGVMDENYNWTFGDGHLVLVGDFLDRGQQVTEVLWLIYSLEEKAKADGGYVHFILGNHEIMNLSGDLRYVNKKYLDNAKLLSKRYESFYDKNSEIGRWLFTKNIIEKIGTRLFTHGGISADVNKMNISISRINQLGRTYYANSTDEQPDKYLKIILSTKTGPFWYRGYYMKDQRATPEQIDETLSKFNVTEIITGHTFASEKISMHYGGKVIDLDTHDYRGTTEGLLIEGEKYYRTNPKGERVSLF